MIYSEKYVCFNAYLKNSYKIIKNNQIYAKNMILIIE